MTLLTRFARNTTGAIAPIVAVGLVPMIALVGAAVDYGRIFSLQSELQSASDSAALIACRSTTITTAGLKTEVTAALSGLMPGRTVAIDSFSTENSPRTLSMTTRVTYTMALLRIPGRTTVEVVSKTGCAAGERFYEIALVLDTTGSMSSRVGTTTKIDALKAAATNFVNTMFTTSDTAHLKISIVPFAASVKVNPTTYYPSASGAAAWLDTAGASSSHWQNILRNTTTPEFTNRFGVYDKLKGLTPAWAWAGCLESLPYPYNTQDVTPSAGTPDTQYVPMLAPDEIGTIRSSYSWWGGTYQYVDPSGSNNSYLDDGTGEGETCNSIDGNDRRRAGQACKYASPNNARTSQPGPNWGCTSRALTRLTNAQASLTTEIGLLSASGSTNIHEGLHWGWRTITRGVFSDASAYGAANTTKIIVLMTDGDNQWLADSGTRVAGSYYSAYGFFNNADGSTTTKRLPSGFSSLSTTDDGRRAIDKLARETCTNATNKGVVIYTVAFSTVDDPISATGKQLLADCAGGSGDRAFVAATAAELNSRFEAIAKGIGQLRITR